MVSEVGEEFSERVAVHIELSPQSTLLHSGRQLKRETHVVAPGDVQREDRSVEFGAGLCETLVRTASLPVAVVETGQVPSEPLSCEAAFVVSAADGIDVILSTSLASNLP